MSTDRVTLICCCLSTCSPPVTWLSACDLLPLHLDSCTSAPPIPSLTDHSQTYGIRYDVQFHYQFVLSHFPTLKRLIIFSFSHLNTLTLWAMHWSLYSSKPNAAMTPKSNIISCVQPLDFMPLNLLKHCLIQSYLDVL